MELRRLVVVGNGMVGQRLLQSLHENSPDNWTIDVFGAEPWAAYDRVHLSSYLEGATIDDLTLCSPEVANDPTIRVHVGEHVTEIDRDTKRITTENGRSCDYDTLVLATGSIPFIPPIPGHHLAGVFPYRTISDLDDLRAAANNAQAGIVIGGGLLGLEAANALRALGLHATVVEIAPRLMPQQLDGLSGEALVGHITAQGIDVVVGEPIRAFSGNESGVTGVRFENGTNLDAQIIVVAAGVRPDDALARDAGLTVGPRGGVVINENCETSDPNIYAIGECVSLSGALFGLVAPGYDMADVVANRLCGGESTFTSQDVPTRLKLLGVDVAVFGDVHATTPGAQVLTWHDQVNGIVKRTVLDATAASVIGGSFVGDAEGYLELLAQSRSSEPLPERLESLLLAAAAASGELDSGTMSDATLVCTCNNVTAGQIVDAVRSGCMSAADVKAATRAGSTCGSCVPLVKRIVDTELERQGVSVDKTLCPHFAHTRQELVDIVRREHITTFQALLAGWGQGHGCAICRPAVASILASLWNEHVLASEHFGLQDTNDRFLANIQRDGTYSVVPRIPGGEISAEKLIVIGEVAKTFDLYVKITGGQRIDLLGARVDQLPAIWKQLIDAGFESGHAYGKALRTVKSCVGSTWCRYGVQDSTSLAVELELRYRGLRSPHKLKSAVSGCARECAEAQSKDFGVLATEAGWNLYVGGNGGMRPRHGELLAENLDTESLIRTIDRFLMYYIRDAEPLERTSTWIERIDGGIDHVRSVVVDDSKRIGAELEAEMARTLGRYECEWKAVLASPEALTRFNHFVNVDQSDPGLAHRTERGQRVPAQAASTSNVAVLIRRGAK